MEEDANLSTFRRGNKIIAVGFTLLIVSIALLILVLHIKIPPSPSDYFLHTFTSPVETFCSYSHPPTCIAAVDSIVTDRFALEPKQIADLCIQTAATDLQSLINASSIHAHKFASADCAESLPRASDRVRESLAARARARARRPFWGWLTKDRDGAVIQRLTAATEEVEQCLRHMAEVEPPETAARLAAKLDRAAVYLHSADRFLVESSSMERVARRSSNFYIRYYFETSLGIIHCGVQLFMLGLLCIFFRNRSSRVSVAQFLRSFSD